jgi:hypothetical protein
MKYVMALNESSMFRKCFLIFILLVITAAYYIPLIKSPLAPYDEAVILVGAERVLKGQTPYEDFLTVYAPGQFYALAFFFKLFGTSVTIERVYDIAIKSLLSLFIFLNIRQLSSHKSALVGWAMSLIWIEYSYFHAYPVYPAILFTFIGIYFLLLHMKNDNLYCVALGAVSIVFAILFRHDLGGLAAIVITIAILLRKIMSKQESWTPIMTYIATGIAVAFPAIIYFLVAYDIEAVINDLFVIPLDMAGTQQKLPYPALSRYNLPFYVFPTVLLVGIITFIIQIKLRTDSTLAYGILLISLVGIVFLNQVWARSDTIHLLPVALTAIVLLPVLFHTYADMLTQNKQLYALFFILFVVFISLTMSKAISKKLKLLPENYNIAVINPEIDRAKYQFISPDYKKAVSYIKKNTSQDDYIYVGVKNHDQLVFNDPIFYFLAERKCATKYHELNPGHTTTLKIQEEMVNELKSKAPRLLVLATRKRIEPNPSGIDTHIDLLDNYIFDNHTVRETYGLFEIWTEKNSLRE